MQILTTICGRAGSKGLAGKNARDFLGFPILFYSLSAYSLFLECFGDRYGSFDFALNTDSDELIRQFGCTSIEGEVVNRKESLAGDRVSKIDVIRDTLFEMEKKSKKIYDLVVDIDLTSPLRRAVDFKNLLDAAVENKDADITLSLTDSRRSPYFNQLIKGEDGFYKTAIKSDFIARQQVPEVFDANASLYAYRPWYLKNADGIFLNAKLAASFMLDTAVLDIDCERDFELMQVIAEYLFESDSEFCEVRDNIKHITLCEDKK